MEISAIWRRIQRSLFPRVEDCLGLLTEEQRKIIAILEIVRIEDRIRQSRSGTGRPPHDWLPIARAFVAKAILNLSSTRALIGRLRADATLRLILGFRTGKPLPHESAFSRVFGALARTEIPERTHAALVDRFVKDSGIAHAALDASAIRAREKARNPRKSLGVKARRKRGRPKRGETVSPPELTGVARTIPMKPSGMKRALPGDCSWGAKTNSQGKYEVWKGYKLHVSVVEGGLPVSCLLTSASLHDSQAAPFLLKKTARKVQGYCLADAAYDAASLRTLSKGLGLVPVIDQNPRRGEKIPMEPDRARRYKARTQVERFFARLKDEFGGRMIYVRGNRKVFAHLMYGVLAILADQLLGSVL
ncbi:MAG: transposase [Nitrospirota bacterium]|nr:transposase [Nitrospirota bacterium]